MGKSSGPCCPEIARVLVVTIRWRVVKPINASLPTLSGISSIEKSQVLPKVPAKPA